MKNIFIALIACFVLSGCVGTKLNVINAYESNEADTFSYEILEKQRVSKEGMVIFESRLNQKMEEFGLLSESNANTKVEITFVNYYMRHGAARALAGVFAGADNITSIVVIKNIKTSEVISKFQVVSKNPSAMGSAKGLIESHADKIADYLKNGSK